MNRTITSPDVDLPVVEQLRAELATIEETVITGYTLADAIREGSTVTTQRVDGWVEGTQACALGAGWVAVKARGYL